MTKQQEKREERYRAQLKHCGFRSWKRANARRHDLIDKKIDSSINEDEKVELQDLQKLCELYVKWKTNDQLGRSIRRAKRLLNKLKD